MNYTSRAIGCLFGLAIGDALGRPTEFLTYARIVEQFGPLGPEAPEGDPAKVTDDTQMAIAVGEAVVRAIKDGINIPVHYAPYFVEAFKEWYAATGDDRAPGATCMAACKSLTEGKEWADATAIHSKGCGANMRVQPIGLLTDRKGFHLKKRSKLAQLQAAVTHGHPAALAASDLTAHAVYVLAAGAAPGELLDALNTHVETQRQVYHEDVLGGLWERAGDASARAYITRGWSEVENALKKVREALNTPQPDHDPCEATGDGWKAEEALATAVHAFLLFPDDAVKATRRAAATRGDSDSIACITGALAGAHHGLDAWPTDWVDRIEYHDRLKAIAEAM